MPTIRVLTWNAFGMTANITGLANAITSLNIDLTVIQEANNNAGNAYYLPLNGLAGYTLVPAIPENATRQTPTGQNIHPNPSVVRSYAYVYRNATVGAVNHGLLDYTLDTAYVVPNSAFNASAQGFNLRPPLWIDLQHNGNTIHVYTWHAPIGHTNNTGLNLFDGCDTLANDIGSGDLVIIAGDTNTNNLTNHFNDFDGIQDGYDAVLAANTAGVVDMRTTAITAGQITLLNALYQAPHWAVPASIQY